MYHESELYTPKKIVQNFEKSAQRGFLLSKLRCGNSTAFNDVQSQRASSRRFKYPTAAAVPICFLIS